jgi:hypothetical protein
MAALLVVLAGCKGKEQPVDPYVTPGTTEDPKWTLSVENDMTASLTAIVKVSFTEKEGTLAAFIGDDCCSVADYIEGLYWLYVSPSTAANSAIQLKFYSPDLKRIFVDKETFPFVNDTQKGTVSAPYTPEWKAE